MACFIYKVKEQYGRALHGLVEAKDLKDAKKKVNVEDCFFVSAELFDRKKLYTQKVNLRILIMFTQRLTALIEAGIPILKAMYILWRQTEDKTIQLVANEIRAELERGNSISSSMEMFPGVFPNSYCALIKVGEKGGALVSVLVKLTQFLEYRASVIERTKRATFYPCIVIVFATIVVLAMFIFIVPIFKGVLLKLNIPLPWITQVSIAISNMLRTWYFYVIVAAAGVGVFYGFRYIHKNEKLFYKFDEMLLKIPYFGELLMSMALSQLLRSFSILLSAGVPILESLAVAKSTTENKKVSTDLTKIRKEIEQGASLYDAFKRVRLFPVMLIEMIGIGESSGMLTKMLDKVTQHYDGEVDYQINKLLTLLEPALILVVGGVVMFVLLSIYLPLTSVWRGILK